MRILHVTMRSRPLAAYARGAEAAGVRPEWRRVRTYRSFLSAIEECWDAVFFEADSPDPRLDEALALLGGAANPIPLIVVRRRRDLRDRRTPPPAGVSAVIDEEPAAQLADAVSGALRDACERAAARLRRGTGLTESESRLRAILDIASDGVWDMDVSSGASYYSANWAGMLGYSPGELAPHIDTWRSLVHPEDKMRVCRAFEDHVAGRTPIYESEFRLRDKRGDWVWVLSRGRVVERDETGAPRRVAGIHTDITDRKERERRLRESEERFREVLEHSRSYHYRINLKEDRYDYLSPNVTEVTGVSLEETMQSGMEQIVGEIHPDDWAVLERRIRDVRLCETTRSAHVDIEYRRRVPDGSYRWLSDSLTLLYNESGDIETVIGSANDVTEVRRTEEACRASEAQFRALAETTPVAFCIVEDGAVTYANPAASAMAGYTPHEAEGMDFLAVTHPDSQPYIRERLAVWRSGDWSPSRSEVKILSKDHRVVWVEMRDSPIVFRGRRAVLLTGVDITERKQAAELLSSREAELRSLLQNMPIMLVAFDHASNIIVWNRECERVTGYTAAEIVSHPEAARSAWAGRADAHDAHGAYADSAESRRESLGTLRSKDGATKSVLWLSIADRFPVPGWADWVVGVDLTVRLHLEREILEISDRERRRIGQDLHDGLGQHLTGIAFLIKALADSLRAHGREEASQAETLGALIAEALAQTRNLAKGLHLVQLEAEGLMMALRELAVSTQQLYGIPCTFECDDDVLVHDAAVANNLYRIAQEALNNAVKHARADRISVRLARDGDTIRLAIRDTGVGFDIDAEPNAGLGLNIMRYRARMIGGALDVRSAPGRGTCVECAAKPSAEGNTGS